MKKPDAVLRELGQLYDFQREIAKFRLKERPRSAKAAAPDPKAAASGPKAAATVPHSEAAAR